MSELANENPEQFVTARELAARWSCHVDTVYARLERSQIRQYRFSARLIRWRWVDIFAFEDSLSETSGSPSAQESLATYVPRKKGPQRLSIKVSQYE